MTVWLDYILIYRIVLMFMIGLISFYQVIVLLWVDFWQSLLAHLKQSGEKLKGDILLLDYLLEPIIASSWKRDCQVGRTRMK